MANLRFWPEREDIIDRSLDVLNELIFSYSSGRLLLQLDVIGSLLLNHTPDHFPFLAVPNMARQRTQFHSALARLVFMEDENDKFEPFMAPILASLEQLTAHAQRLPRTEEVMVRRAARRGARRARAAERFFFSPPARSRLACPARLPASPPRSAPSSACRATCAACCWPRTTAPRTSSCLTPCSRGTWPR